MPEKLWAFIINTDNDPSERILVAIILIFSPYQQYKCAIIDKTTWQSIQILIGDSKVNSTVRAILAISLLKVGLARSLGAAGWEAISSLINNSGVNASVKNELIGLVLEFNQNHPVPATTSLPLSSSSAANGAATGATASAGPIRLTSSSSSSSSSGSSSS